MDAVKVKLDEPIFIDGELYEAGQVIECPKHFAIQLKGTRKGHVVTDEELTAAKAPAAPGKTPEELAAEKAAKEAEKAAKAAEKAAAKKTLNTGDPGKTARNGK